VDTYTLQHFNGLQTEQLKNKNAFHSLHATHPYVFPLWECPEKHIVVVNWLPAGLWAHACNSFLCISSMGVSRETHSSSQLPDFERMLHTFSLIAFTDYIHFCVTMSMSVVWLYEWRIMLMYLTCGEMTSIIIFLWALTLPAGHQ